MAAGPWTDDENDLIVADYFAMLAAAVAGRSYSKAEHNRGLQARIGRGRGAIEYKHQNISAVLMGLGETWVPGYKPAFNFQASLVEAVVRWLDAHPAWLTRLPTASNPSTGTGAMAEATPLWIGPPPTMRNEPEPQELDQLLAVARKFDVVARDERNRALGRAGEERVLAHERSALRAAGQDRLAGEVRWVSDLDGDGAGFDIASYEPDGRPRLIEVKTTNGWERTPFHISRNELAVADANPSEWRLVRLYDFSREAKAFELRPPLDRHVSLTPTSFQARLHQVHSYAQGKSRRKRLLYEKYKSSQRDRMQDPRAISNLIVGEGKRSGRDVTNLALQKLLYFAHAHYLVERKEPLVSGFFEAWQYGPVHPTVYHAFKSAGDQPINFTASRIDPLTGEKRDLPPVDDPAIVRHVERVMLNYGALTPGRLVEISHAKKAPWDFIVENSRSNVSLGLRIPDDVIIERFKHHKVSVASVPSVGEPTDDTPLFARD